MGIVRPAFAPALVAVALLSGAAVARAQGGAHKPEPWVVSVNHRIDLNAHVRRVNPATTGQDVQVVGPAARHVINLASGILVDTEGHVVTRLVNLDPRSPEHDLQITTSAGRIVKATFVGFDGPTGLALLSAPELRGTKPAPALPLPALADGQPLRLVSAEYKLSQISVPVERVALFPTLAETPARASTAPLTRALARAGVVAIVECAALTSSKDLSLAQTVDGRLVGIVKYVSPGRGQVLSVSFLHDVVARRLVDTNGSIAAGWLGAEGMSLKDLRAERRPTWAPESGVLIQVISARSPADLAGLRRNDCIIGFADVPVAGTSDLATAVVATPAGTSVELAVLRDGETVKLTTVLGGRPLTPGIPSVVMATPERAASMRLAMLNQQLARTKDAAAREKVEAEIREVQAELYRARQASEPNDPQFESIFDDTVLRDLGISGYPLKAQLAQHFGVAGGIFVDEVSTSGIGHRAGLAAADVIVRAGDAPIAAEDELAEAVLGAVRAGKPSVEITVLRGGQSVVLSFPLEGFRKP